MIVLVIVLVLGLLVRKAIDDEHDDGDENGNRGSPDLTPLEQKKSCGQIILI
jgi:hypothetical protein